MKPRRRIAGSRVQKRSIVIARHKTSLSLEDDFWLSLKEIAGRQGIPVRQLVIGIDVDRDNSNLSSAIRLFVLEHYRRLAVKAALAPKAKRAAG